MSSPKPEIMPNDAGDKSPPQISTNPANANTNVSNDTEVMEQDGNDLAKDAELMRMVAEHGPATSDDEATAASPAVAPGSVQAAPEQVAENHQQSEVVTIDDNDDPHTDAENTGSEASDRRAMAPPAPTLNIGTSILRTPASSSNPDLARIQAAQRSLREKMLAARQARDTPSLFSTFSAPASHDSGTGEIDEEEEAEHRRLVAAWKRQKADFDKRKKIDKTTTHEEIEHLRDQREEDARVRRYKECRDRVAEESRRQITAETDAQSDQGALFCSDRRRNVLDDSEDGMGSDDDNEDDLRRSVTTKRQRATSAKRKILSTERIQPGDEEDLLALIEEVRPNKRSKKGEDTAPLKKAKKPGRPKGSKNSKSKKQPDKNEKLGHQLTNFKSLYTTDVIKDARQNQALGDQPTFQSHLRSEVRKQLIASLPKDQRKINAIDKNYVLSSLKDFVGHRTIKQVPDVGNGESGWLLKGMKSPLKHFQLLGSAFMRRRERGDDEPFGGLDADGMGLGKTVMMLANIADALRYRKRGEGVSTLIIAPAALVGQWKSEIERHLDLTKLGRTPARPVSILVYTKAGKYISSDIEADIARHEFVLTTYDEIRRSFPQCKEPPAFSNAEEKRQWWTDFVDKNKGPLHNIHWARIVLDEAQAIKNRKSSTSLACRWLQGRCRWALSGTPIPNRTNELYPYFRFLKVPNTGCYSVFSENFIGRNDPDKQDRLQVFLSKILLRRTHADRLFNQPLVKLPEPSEHVHFVEFNSLERSIYEIVRRRMIERINHFSKEGELEKNYRNVLVMLLRLRQLTGHVLAVQSTLNDLFELEDHERLKELAEEEADTQTVTVRRAQITQLRVALAKQHGDDEIDSDQEPVPKRSETDGPCSSDPLDPSNLDDEFHLDPDKALGPRSKDKADQRENSRRSREDNRPISTGRSHGLNYDFRHYLDSLRKGKEFEKLQQRQLCAVCDQQPQDAWITSCYHVMCLDCLEFIQEEAAKLERERARCPECGDVFYNANPLEGWELDCEESDVTEYDANEGLDSDGQGSKKRKEKGKTKQLDWIDMPNHNLLPSSKTTAIKAQVLNWLEKDPSQKIIIYTQFLDMIRILARVCRTEHWGYKQYHGNMRMEDRNKAIKQFKDDKKTSILLASLKCGGVGLNLTMASRVIVVEPWWNKAIEQQAFCRVFRIGQAHETYMTRFAVKGTVDEAMVNMQDRKEDEIEEVMNDPKGRRSQKLPLEELMRLFGETREDDKGKPFIVVDNFPETTHVSRDSDDEMFGDED